MQKNKMQSTTVGLRMRLENKGWGKVKGKRRRRRRREKKKMMMMMMNKEMMMMMMMMMMTRLRR